ncbi:carbohydrate binding domain-containing protein [Paenibacillus methanolicus]|uniref:Beta-glucanase (GH16 family) n=1 Tax=Paenibacillus methanolicus TaxID=582686 RepID=A0A5S5CCM0_9BACL|nr:carbohydrate binding domain-containing protein [Paenibacillus methanolicus]TYP76398.1 beta-glucanase (GH16 family) [Paenibacillus methanolicus]
MNKTNWLSAILAGGLLISAISPAAYASETKKLATGEGFADVSGAHWAKSAVEQLQALGLMTGDADGRFLPNRPITRAEFVAVLDRAFGYAGDGSKSFADVLPEAWYYRPVMNAAGSGIVEGTEDGQFAPNAPITREDAAVLLDRAFQLSSGSESDATLRNFQDSEDVAGYAKKALTYLVETKMLKGANGRLLPKKPMTRAESALLLAGMMAVLIAKPTQYDAAKITGNVVVRTGGVTMKNTVIEGNLLLAEGIGEGEVALEGVTVTGSTIIKGGGSHSIVFKNAKLGRVVVDKRGEPVRVAFQDGTKADNVNVLQPAQIEVAADSAIGAMTFGETANASKLTAEGKIGQLLVEADKVTVNGEDASAGYSGTFEPKAVSSTPVVTTTPGNPGTSPGDNEPPVAPTTIPDQDWELVWRDEFNAAAIDASKWTVMDTDVVYNNELEYYSPNNASIQKDGSRSVLNVTAKKEAYRGSDYTSAKLTTQGKGDWTYGKVVVRAKLPVDQGMWPAIWMLPTDEAHYGGWPASGEIDIMELIGGEQSKQRVYGTLHYDRVQPDGSHGHDQGTYELAQGATFADGYHDFQVEWLPGVIRFYVDGRLYHEVSDWKTKGPGQPEYYTYPAPFDRPFYLILNLAVGGDWPGAPDADFVSDEMKVDFVRVYSYKKLDEWPDVTGHPPDPAMKRQPQQDGNQLYNHDFKGEHGADGVPQHWQFLLNAGGEGSVSVVDDETKGMAAKVSIANPGEQLYSIQLTQMPMYIQRGKRYKVTFDAKADASRTIMAKVNQFQKSWKNYSGEQTFALTTAWQPYTYTFDMRETTDNNARFEFNLGLNEGMVYIANAKLVEIGDAPPLPDETIERKPLPDGNLVYNGTFDQGTDRLAFWSPSVAADAKARIGVNNFLAFPIMERQLVVQVEEGGAEASSVAVSHPGLKLEANAAYGLYFEAKSDAPRTMQVDVARSNGGSAQFPQGASVQLGTELESYAKEIVIGPEADAEAELKLLFGGEAGTVYVDNVRLVKRGQPVHVAGYAHIPASQAWEMRGLQLEDASEGGTNVGYMDEGDLLQYKVSVAENAEYVLSARVASGEADSPVRLRVKDESGATVAEAVANVGNSGGWQTYKTVYFEPIALASGRNYYVDFEGYDYNTLWVDLSRNIARNGKYDSGTEAWNMVTTDSATMAVTESGELSVRHLGTGAQWWDHQVQQLGLTIEQGKTYRLELDARSSAPRTMHVVVSQSSGEYAKYLIEETALAEEKSKLSYTFKMDAPTDAAAVLSFGLGMPATAGGAHTVAIDNVKLYEVNPAADAGGQPVNVNLLHNGDFASGTEGWFSYAAGDASQLAIAAEGGKLQVAIGNVGDYPWDRQVINEGFAIQQGSRYTLTFKAKAGTPRKLGLGLGWVDVAANYEWHGYFGQQADLTTEEQLYTFTFDATAESYRNARISFDMGNISGGNAGQTTITLSEVSLVNIGPASNE